MSIVPGVASRVDGDWRLEAACRDENPELFFPVGSSGPAKAQVAAAKAVCHRCTVASDCLAWALANGQDAGVWGGMDESERRAFKRRRAALRRAQQEADEKNEVDGQDDAGDTEGAEPDPGKAQGASEHRNDRGGRA